MELCREVETLAKLQDYLRLGMPSPSRPQVTSQDRRCNTQGFWQSLRHGPSNRCTTRSHRVWEGGKRGPDQLSTRLDTIVASVLSLSLSLSGQLLSLTDPGFDVTHGNALLHQRLGGDLGP